jgi:protein ImuB
VVALNRRGEILGVTRGMTKAAVSQFAGVLIRPRCSRQEEAAHAALLDVAWSVTPRVEDAAPDTLLVDISGLGSLFGNEEGVAREIAFRAAAFGMDVHIAVSANVETARIVARALPGSTIVPAGEEQRFLETLPVSMLSPSAELSDIFARWGVSTCKALASLPALSLSECVGQEGVRLHVIASGKGMRPLLMAEPAQNFAEWLELDEAVEDLESLSFLLGRLLDQLSARLAARALAIAAVQVYFELQPAFDHAFDTSLELLRTKAPARTYSCTLELPVPTRDSKLLLKLVRLRLQSRPPGAPIQKIHMTAQSSLARVTQGSLFIPTAPDPHKLELTIARIVGVVGEGNVGSPQLLDSHKPDAFQVQKFSVAVATDFHVRSNATKLRKHNSRINSQSSAPKEQLQQIALHFFRPPLPARVQVLGNKPVHVAFQGCFGKVIHASGPWRSSGHWWEEQPWQEDAWDVEIEFSAAASISGGSCNCSGNGFYRFAYDALLEKWFVKGVYD